VDDAENTERPADPFYGRDLDLESLKAFAHPLRVRIVDVLSTYGSFTASGLAERLGESSGATSYHLRQLEKNGFVREVEGKGTGRERWWERSPGGINISQMSMRESAAAREASDVVMRQWNENRNRIMDDFHERGMELLSEEWLETSMLSTSNVRMTVQQLKALVDAWEQVYLEHIEKIRGQDVPGSRPVQVHFNAFPVVDGVETPLDAPAEDEKR
jgi:DNA-binding transcriptional ArsR family regulator